MTSWATPESIQSAADSWTDGQVQCRTYGHSWRSLTATHSPGVYTVYQRCTRCSAERHQDINERGYPLSPWRTRYTDGYLLRNVGRVGVDGRAVLRLSSLRSIEVTEFENADG